MKRAQKYGLVFNDAKCHIKVPEVSFFGMIYSKEGVRPDPKKVEDITNLPSPGDVHSLQQFLGMVQYLSAFIPQLSAKTTVLRDLTKQDREWNWLSEHKLKYAMRSL